MHQLVTLRRCTYLSTPYRRSSLVKAAFHDTDTNTDTDILAIHPREDPRGDVGFGVSVVECGLYATESQ